jgi:ketol-acid reductoisomerase
MTKTYYDKDASFEVLKEKTITIIGYGNQGEAQAKNMRDSKLRVILGLRKGGNSWKKAKEDGFEVYPINEATRKGDIIHVLIPDEVQPKVYEKEIKENLDEGNALCFSHGFSIRFNFIVPPKNIDVIMVAPKGVGVMVRETYTEGFGVPALIAVDQDYSGKAKDIALALAKAIGSTRVGVIKTTFKDETDTDLFSEQVDLCGGVSELIKASFDILVKEGYSKEAAYFETLHELKLIIDLIHQGGLAYMWSKVSNTAEYGGRTRGKRVIDEHVKEEMREILSEIKSGKFANEWIFEYEKGAPKLKKMREEDAELEIEKIGAELRKMFK